MFMLDAICSAQQSALEAKIPTFAVVTSLQVEGMHARVTIDSQRPLHSIPLYPCSVADIDDIVDKVVDFEVANGKGCPMCAADDRAALLWAAHGTGGHFRSLEKLHRSYRNNPSSVTQAQVIRTSRSAANILHVMAKRLLDPSLTMKETDLIGDAFSKRDESMTLYNAAMSNVDGVFYQSVNAEHGLVSPRVMPCGLSVRAPFRDADVAQSVVKFWGKMNELLTTVKATKGWEMGVPLLEVMAWTLMYEVNGMMPVAFSEVWRDAYVQPWAGREGKLYYRPVGTNCVSVYKLGATERTHAADDEALRAACKSMEPTLGWAETTNYRTIEGVHTLLEEESPPGTRSLIIQMQGHKDVTGQQLVDWANAAHIRATLCTF
ncbi:Hypothetical protein, putative [Bodo saltans]|uniref:Uncharacterized protein n=1 Tax=Bodo saltans TaxID=75058 RepID=A0A0S4JQR4_BODSA|nr:Hypothetical protein, putative [Bodo saltans]|eukprot:CUG91706.1 Hypothetical protein, putative [Bodo saltans]